MTRKILLLFALCDFQHVADFGRNKVHGRLVGVSGVGVMVMKIGSHFGDPVQISETR